MHIFPNLPHNKRKTVIAYFTALLLLIFWNLFTSLPILSMVHSAFGKNSLGLTLLLTFYSLPLVIIFGPLYLGTLFWRYKKSDVPSFHSITIFILTLIIGVLSPLAIGFIAIKVDHIRGQKYLAEQQRQCQDAYNKNKDLFKVSNFTAEPVRDEKTGKVTAMKVGVEFEYLGNTVITGADPDIYIYSYPTGLKATSYDKSSVIDSEKKLSLNYTPGSRNNLLVRTIVIRPDTKNASTDGKFKFSASVRFGPATLVDTLLAEDYNTLDCVTNSSGAGSTFISNIPLQSQEFDFKDFAVSTATQK